jgi:hypothetical protein
VIRYLTVRALPRSFDEEYRRQIGENRFCDEWDLEAEQKYGLETCAGLPEVELTIVRTVVRNHRSEDERINVHLCREHAGYIATQLREAIELVDGADILRTKKGLE